MMSLFALLLAVMLLVVKEGKPDYLENATRICNRYTCFDGLM